MAPELTVIVVSFDTRDLTLACLASIFEQTRRTTFEVIVVDNASSDGSAQAIAACFPGVRLIASPENLGFARANNLAARSARGRRLLLLNPDTVVIDAGIDRLVDFARARPRARIWGGRTVFADGSLNPASCWMAQSIWSCLCCASGLSSIFRRSSLFNPEGIGGWDRTGERRVDIVSGCFLLIDADLWNELSGFDPAFFMYGEEADLCLRAAARGARPCVTGDATVIHLGGASERVRADKMVRLLRAKIELIRRHFPRRQRALGVWLLSLWPLSRAVAWCAMGLLGVRAADDAGSVWREVWARRGEWRAGYSGDGGSLAAERAAA